MVGIQSKAQFSDRKLNGLVQSKIYYMLWSKFRTKNRTGMTIWIRNWNVSNILHVLYLDVHCIWIPCVARNQMVTALRLCDNLWTSSITLFFNCMLQLKITYTSEHLNTGIVWIWKRSRLVDPSQTGPEIEWYKQDGDHFKTRHKLVRKLNVSGTRMFTVLNETCGNSSLWPWVSKGGEGGFCLPPCKCV
jgi:hypothetical protein